MMLNLWFLVFYFISFATCAYIPIQDDHMPSKAVNMKNNVSDCIPVRFELDKKSNLYAKMESRKNMINDNSISAGINTNCHLCKRSPLNPWQKVKHKYRSATPARQQHVAIATGAGLVTLGAIATPVPESPMKREIQDINTLSFEVDGQESIHTREKNNNDAEGILCTFDQFDGQITKRSQFLQTAGMTVMFGGMVIGPGVASIKSHMSKKDKLQPPSSATIAKRSPSFFQPNSNMIKLQKRGTGLEFLNTVSLAGMVGGTVIVPGVAAIKTHQQKKNQRLQKRSPNPGIFKSIFKAIPTAISTGKDIHGIIKHKKRSLQEDEEEFAPIFEKRFRGLGKMLGHLNTAGTLAMVGSAGLAAHGSIKEGWNQKKNAAAAAAASAAPPKKRDLEINISPNRDEIVILKRQPTRGLNGGRARSSRGSKGQARNAARAERAAQASPKMTKMEKTMTGLGAAMSAGMIVSFAGEAKNAISGQPARKREEAEEGMALIKRGLKLFGKSKSMPARRPASKPAAKPSPKPVGKAAPKNGKPGGGIGGKVAGAAGAAMSAASVISFAGEAKAAVQKPPPQAGAAPAARKRALDYSSTMLKRSPKPLKIGGSPRSRTKPNKPAPARSQSSAGSGGSKFGGALETAGTVSMVASMATPVLTPAASAAHNAWDKVRATFGGKKKQA